MEVGGEYRLKLRGLEGVKEDRMEAKYRRTGWSKEGSKVSIDLGKEDRMQRRTGCKSGRQVGGKGNRTSALRQVKPE